MHCIFSCISDKLGVPQGLNLRSIVHRCYSIQYTVKFILQSEIGLASLNDYV